ncbi:PadR family transcriptional regulator [Iningainema tapete]|uniref:PadR family transcriptional regulator n=1 Tax=Iningainema tapete BLCC-T55 TaxID=2748662 RepID=A0A8J7C783_9CYAN|nr:PadR family transcriptional regulator [Iningainema tapete]MBD2772861.1 PadR family transcriptional regulator [Iningainema tapete BLCC-T55]
MFKQFHHHSHPPAWEGANFDNQFFPSERFERGRFGRGRGEEPRTRRGDIKFILLGLLSECPRHGYELIKELETRDGGFRRLSPGSVYPTLQLLEEGGYLTSEQIEGKRVYTITDSGRQLLSDRHQHKNPVDNPGNTDKSSELIELRNALTDLTTAVTLIARSGNPEQANQVRELLIQVKREIFKMLSN